MLRPQPAAYPAGQVALYPLSYRRMERRAGFEPATSRLTDEVTDIFTTDREGVGGERTMLLPPLRAPFWRRSNRHLHHRRTEACASAMSRHAGEQAKSVSVIQLPSIPRDGREPWRMRDPCLGRSTVRDFTGGIRTRFFHWSEVSEIFTTSVGLAAGRGKPENETCLCAARDRCAAVANRKKRFALSSVSGSSPRSLRQAPRARARASPARAPGSGSPVPASRPGYFKRALLRKIKNPPELLAREGP